MPDIPPSAARTRWIVIVILPSALGRKRSRYVYGQSARYDRASTVQPRLDHDHDRLQDSAMLDEGTASLGFLSTRRPGWRGRRFAAALQATKVIAARAIVNSAVKQFVEVNEASTSPDSVAASMATTSSARFSRSAAVARLAAKRAMTLSIRARASVISSAC